MVTKVMNEYHAPKVLNNTPHVKSTSKMVGMMVNPKMERRVLKSD
jgi:hypothetical protein